MGKRLLNRDITKIREQDITKITQQCPQNYLKKWERQVPRDYVKTTGKWTEIRPKIDLVPMDSWTKEFMKLEKDQIQTKLNLLTLTELLWLAWCIQLHGCTTKLARNIHFIRDLLRKKLKWPKPWALFNGAAPELVDKWCLLHQQDLDTKWSKMTEIKSI